MLPKVPPRPPTRRERRVFSLSEPISPLDSGYGSSSSTPRSPDTSDKENEQPLSDLRNYYDGNQSDSDPFLDSDCEGSFLDPGSLRLGSSPPRQQREPLRRSATLPQRAPPRARPILPPSFYSLPDASRRRRGANRATRRHLDRFIPDRSHDVSSAERFRISKDPAELTPTERLVRHSRTAEDPFVYRRRVVTPIGSGSRVRPRAEVVASRNEVGSVLGLVDQNRIEGNGTLANSGAGWTAGRGGTAVNNGRGQLVRSGTNAPLFRTTFPTTRARSEEEAEKHKARLAAALGLDQTQRVLDISPANGRGDRCVRPGYVPSFWTGTEWVNDGPVPKPQKPLGNRTLPIAPFKVLDAPNLRDDFYCSILAYSSTTRTLAVGLGNLLYGWSEARGVQLLYAGSDPDCYLTSLSFSSIDGCRAILAFGRSDGTFGLMSLYDETESTGHRSAPRPRFDVVQQAPVSCVSWKPVCTLRPSRCPFNRGIPVKNEDLLVGDDSGLIYYYAVEWPARWEVDRHNWPGEITLLARISVHSRQICGLAWSKTGDVFCTGGNDNVCYLFETAKAVSALSVGREAGQRQSEPPSESHPQGLSEVSEARTEIQMSQDAPYYPAVHLGPRDAKHQWAHSAAVKAIAFCPWQDSLVATGGGSNDKCIHFFHTGSGTALASISVSAQVTSLIWSTARREIAATFGYAHPDHPVRIAVFSWPECRQVAAIPWVGEHRALYAIPYTGGPLQLGETGDSEGKTPNRGLRSKEGCIIVACSDKSVKFHEVWTTDRKGTKGVAGVLGGSPILELLEGIDREGMVIR